MKAQAEMFQLLSLHFDGETGRYAKGWSDGKIASTTGIAVEMVTAFRVAGFGELKEAPEIVAIRAEIASLESRSEEHTSELQSLMRNSYAVLCLKKNSKNT